MAYKNLKIISLKDKITGKIYTYYNLDFIDFSDRFEIINLQESLKYDIPRN